MLFHSKYSTQKKKIQHTASYDKNEQQQLCYYTIDLLSDDTTYCC